MEVAPQALAKPPPHTLRGAPSASVLRPSAALPPHGAATTVEPFARLRANRGAIMATCVATVAARRRQRCNFRRIATMAGSDAKPSGPLVGSIFLWQIPLDLPAPLPSVLSTLLPKHSVVLAESTAGGVVAFDFEPQEKMAPLTALRLLSGGAAPGRFGVKHLRRLPPGAVRLGSVAKGSTVEDVTVSLNATYNPSLALLSNDCNSYSKAVLALLLAEANCCTGQRLYSTIDLEALEERGEVVYKEPSLFGAAVLVAGTTVGAGILALPAVTQPVGFAPSSVGLLIAWLYMAATGLLIAEVALADMASSGKRATSLQSMAARTVGPLGAALSSASFVVVHFGLLVAYLSRGGVLLAVALPSLAALSPVPSAVIFSALSGGFVFVTKGTDTLEQVNNVFAAVVLISFLTLVALVLPSADTSRLVSVAEWAHMGDIAPTLLLSLVYHNVVPTVCTQLEGDRGKITTAIVAGSFIPFLMFLVWNAAIIAAVPPGAIGMGDPLDALRASGGPELAVGVLVFSLSAIITSFVGFVIALTDFFADALGPVEDDSSGVKLKLRDFALTLLPPLAVACYDPTIFFQAIDKAGAFGVSTLFGFLPAWMALMQRATESPVLVQTPGFLGGYVRGPLVPGGLAMLMLVAGGAIAVVVENVFELLGVA